jgi:hypothetical protein
MWWKKIVFHNYFLVAAILSVLSVISITFSKIFLPDIIPLYYGKPTGVEQLSNFWFFFIIPSVSLLVTTVNVLISMSAKDEFIKKILAISSLAVSIMATIAVIKIIFLVGFF